STILKILGLPENLNDRLKQLLLEKFSDINVNQNNIERT
ncbi:Abi family protein, partial [Lachnospiraceae bacterium]|nr:Abi family protein [Lachnospiraceae bacterium]NBI61483.1 Abi family protein [Lachnospiraceae bacterium]